MASPDDALQKYLSGLSGKVRKRLADAVREEAEGLADDIAAHAPEETGRLRRSVKVTPGASDLEQIVSAGGDETTKEVRDGSGVEYDYAIAVEFGTQHAPAQPFFWPTYRARRRDIVDNIQSAVQEALEE